MSQLASGRGSHRAGPGLGAAAAVGALFALVGVATLVTYARIPPQDTYHVSVEGLAGGLGRLLVFLNFPAALAAIPVTLLALDRLPTRGARLIGALAIALCALVPFTVDQDDLDARLVNVAPALGVAICVGLAVAAARRGGLDVADRARGDGLRIVLAVALAVLAVPWAFAEAGFYAPAPILADEPSPDEPIAAVHLGRHHGTDGVLLAVAALALSRELRRFRSRGLATGAAAVLSLMLAYGLANAVQDAWLEQVVKRGTTDVELPSMILPSLSWGWAGIVAGAAAIFALWFGREPG